MLDFIQQLLTHHSFAVITNDDCRGPLDLHLQSREQALCHLIIQASPCLPIQANDLLLMGMGSWTLAGRDLTWHALAVLSLLAFAYYAAALVGDRLGGFAVTRLQRHWRGGER